MSGLVRKYIFLRLIMYTVQVPEWIRSIEIGVEVTFHANGIQTMNIKVRRNWLRKKFDIFVASQFVLHNPSLNRFIELCWRAEALELNVTSLT